jgi:hypothetical protein
MSLAQRLRLFLRVLPIVVVLVALKAAVHWAGLEFISLDGLIPSLIAGSIFIIGFLLSHVISDYKEAERMPGEIRVALETIHDEAANFALASPGVDLAGLRRLLAEIVSAFETCLGTNSAHSDLQAVIAQVDSLSAFFTTFEQLEMSQRYIVRLRHAQDGLRRCLFRVSYMQRMQFVPSVHILVQTLVLACLFLLLFLKTSGSYEPVLILGFVGYLFIYLLSLIRNLEQPFRKGERSVDDVSLFLLRDFADKIGRA